MIKHPLVLIFVLLFIEITILYASNHKRFKKYFEFLPSIFWIYFLPMIFSTAGIIDSKSPLLPKISTYLLPASLFLLLVTVDISAIFKLGKYALMMFFAGSLGVMIGIPMIFFLFKDLVGREMWSSFGALSASWIGGSANLIAVKEALGAPDNIFMPIVVVDTVVPYFWMGILVSCAGLQKAFDRWNKANPEILRILSQNMGSNLGNGRPGGRSPGPVLLIVFLALAAGAFSIFIAQKLPVIKDVVNTYAWTILIVSFLGLGASLTPLRNLEKFGSNRIGYFMLFFVLTSLGARASLSNMNSSIILVAAGFLAVFIHAIVLLIAARIFRVPFFLAATASQANFAFSAAPKTHIFPKNPASGGIPPSESRQIAISAAIVGSRCARPE